MELTRKALPVAWFDPQLGDRAVCAGPQVFNPPREAKSCWVDTDGDKTWRPCFVHDFDPAKELYTIQWNHARSGAWKKVSSLQLLFKGDDEQTLALRVAAAKVGEAEASARLAERVRGELVARVDKQRAGATELHSLVRTAIGRVEPLVEKADSSAVQLAFYRLVQEVQQAYHVAMSSVPPRAEKVTETHLAECRVLEL